MIFLIAYLLYSFLVGLKWCLLEKSNRHKPLVFIINFLFWPALYLLLHEDHFVKQHLDLASLKKLNKRLTTTGEGVKITLDGVEVDITKEESLNLKYLLMSLENKRR